ncbi:hypothetical protein V5O48_013786, partial [Marasmius crinis-equi]
SRRLRLPTKPALHVHVLLAVTQVEDHESGSEDCREKDFIVNVLTFFGLGGSEQDWVCMTTCVLDVTLNAIIIFWVSSGAPSDSVNHFTLPNISQTRNSRCDHQWLADERGGISLHEPMSTTTKMDSQLDLETQAPPQPESASKLPLRDRATRGRRDWRIYKYFTSKEGNQKDELKEAPLDSNVLRAVLKRFPTAQKAISALTRLGAPPTVLDITQDEPGWTVIYAFGSLFHAMRHPRSQNALDAIRDIKANWELCIAPWLGALLRAMVAKSDDKENDVFEQGLIVIPPLISCNMRSEASESQPDYGPVHRMHLGAPYIRPLVIRIWLKMVEQRHQTRKTWTLSSVYYAFGLFENLATRTRDRDEALSYLDIQPALTEVDVGMVVVKFLNDVRKDFGRLDNDGILELSKVLGIADHQGMAPHKPLYNRKIARYATPVLVKLLALFLFKWRALPPIRSIVFQWCYKAVVAILGHLTYVLQRGRVWIEEALDAGFIRTVFRADPKFLYYEQYLDAVPIPTKASQLIGELFNCINRLLVWPSMLRQAWRWIKKIEKEGYEMSMSHVQTKTHWWSCWVRMKEKAGIYRDMMRAMKEEECFCCNPTCTLRGLPDEDLKRRKVKYFRCYDCHTAIYCSRKCQKEDWKVSHRIKCNTWARRWAEGHRPVSYADECFLRRLMHHYFDLNDNRIHFIRSLEAYTPSPVHTRYFNPQWKAVPEEWRLRSRPIIALMNFDTQVMVDAARYFEEDWGPECLDVVEPDQLIKTLYPKEERIIELLEAWKGLPDGSCLGIGFFPDGTPAHDGVLVAEVLDQSRNLRLRA